MRTIRKDLTEDYTSHPKEVVETMIDKCRGPKKG